MEAGESPVVVHGPELSHELEFCDSPLGVLGFLSNFSKVSKYGDAHEKGSVLAESGVDKSVQQTG